MTGFPLSMQRHLLDLQDLDSRADGLQQQRHSHPAVAALADLRARAAELEDQRQGASQAVQAARAAVRAAEGEAEAILSRQQRDQTRLDAGAVSSPRELESLQHEIATLQEKLSAVEDGELEAMQTLEDAEIALAAVSADLDAVTSSREQHESDLAHLRAAIDEELATLASTRADLVEQLSPRLVERYERSRGQHSGVGAAALRHGRCEGCQLMLTPVDLARVAAAPEDEVLHCEECGRLLIRVEDA